MRARPAALVGAVMLVLAVFAPSVDAQPAARKPNILITGALAGNAPSPRKEVFSFVTLRVPKLFNLRSDPFETADHEGMDYNRWRVEHLFVLVPGQQFVGQFLSTFKDYPPRQKPGSFSIDQALESLQRGSGDK